MTGERSRPALAASVLCACVLLAGCLGIDRTPLRDQPFYWRTQERLGEIAPFAPDPNHLIGPLAAGGAKVEITPPAGTPLAGYGNRLGRSSIGIHDAIFSRALSLSDGANTIILIANDLLAITDDLYEATYRKITAQIDMSRDALMISATHTHSGPGALARKFWEGFATGPFDPVLFERTTDAMAQAALSAYRGMRPARMGGTRVAVPELIRNRMRKDGPTDPALEFLAIQTLDRHSTFYVANYSAHATVLRHNNYMISGDFPGAFSRHLEQSQGVIALYTAGAVADLTANPPGGLTDFEKAEKMGTALASKILMAMPSMAFEERVPIRAARLPFDLPPTQIRTGKEVRMASPLGNLIFDRESSIHAFRIGAYLLLGVPCDLSSQIGREFKERLEARGFKGLIIGFANDYIGYVIPEEYYYTDAYEARMSFNGPYMDLYLKEIGLNLAEKIAALPPSGGSH